MIWAYKRCYALFSLFFFSLPFDNEVVCIHMHMCICTQCADSMCAYAGVIQKAMSHFSRLDTKKMQIHDKCCIFLEHNMHDNNLGK